MIITLSGVDGSGKTTIGKLLFNRLERQGYKVKYRVEFDYFLLGYLKKVINLISGKRNTANVIKTKILIEKSYPILIGKIWVYLTFFDLLIEYFLYKLFFKKKIIIFDRCVYDFLVGWEWIGYSDKYTRWLYLRFPKFDHSYLLDVNPKIAFERKKDKQQNDLFFFISLRKMYLKLNRKVNLFTILKTSLNKEIVIERIVKDIKSNYIFKESKF